MQVSQMLWQHLDREGLCPQARSLEEWMDVRWLTLKIRGRAVPVYPTFGLRDSLAAHDVHHILTGFDTTLRGEAELAAWELASGGCGRSLFFWIDRLVLLLAGGLLMPRVMARAFRRGLSCRNLYGLRREQLLEADVDDLRRKVFPSG